MSYQMVFQRYEIKYQLSRSQASSLLKVMKPYMTLDIYGHTTIRNIYFDTDTYRLIRHSIERPAYKEKLRLRSYAPAKPEDPVFISRCRNTRKLPRRLTISAHITRRWLLYLFSRMSATRIVLWTGVISASPWTKILYPAVPTSVWTVHSMEPRC